MVTLRASGDFQKQAGVLGNRDMGGETELFGSMRTIPVQFDNGRVFGLYALLEAGKGKPLSGSIPSIGTRGKATVGDKGPAVAILAAFEQGFTCEFFIPGVVSRSKGQRPACGQIRSYAAHRIWHPADESWDRCNGSV